MKSKRWVFILYHWGFQFYLNIEFAINIYTNTATPAERILFAVFPFICGFAFHGFGLTQSTVTRKQMILFLTYGQKVNT